MKQVDKARELIDTLWNVNGDNVFTYEADELPN